MTDRSNFNTTNFTGMLIDLITKNWDQF